jgi:hypothetical protein
MAKNLMTGGDRIRPVVIEEVYDCYDADWGQDCEKELQSVRGIGEDDTEYHP